MYILGIHQEMLRALWLLTGSLLLLELQSISGRCVDIIASAYFLFRADFAFRKHVGYATLRYLLAYTARD